LDTMFLKEGTQSKEKAVSTVYDLSRSMSEKTSLQARNYRAQVQRQHNNPCDTALTADLQVSVAACTEKIIKHGLFQRFSGDPLSLVEAA